MRPVSRQKKIVERYWSVLSECLGDTLTATLCRHRSALPSDLKVTGRGSLNRSVLTRCLL